jgi:hypothetical protein
MDQLCAEIKSSQPTKQVTIKGIELQEVGIPQVSRRQYKYKHFFADDNQFWYSGRQA